MEDHLGKHCPTVEWLATRWGDPRGFPQPLHDNEIIRDHSARGLSLGLSRNNFVFRYRYCGQT